MSIFGSSATEKTHNSLSLLYSGAPFSSSGKKQTKKSSQEVQYKRQKECIGREASTENWFLLQWRGICRDISDDETLFAVAPWQGIPQPLLKRLNLAGVGFADALLRVQKVLCQTF